MSKVVITAHELGKAYKVPRLGHEPQDHVAVIGRTLPTETFWALKDVSFEVKEGEIVGIIGPNGAGKTTLLKILSRVTQATEGWAEVKGRLGSLLQVGAGFHGDLSGRENVYFNGAILGMSRNDISRKFDEIVEFAEVSRFIDFPLKHYSSGMAARLAFSVAAHLEPEVLILDEALSVGDSSFQRKSQQKMREVIREGRTVLIVSHNLSVLPDLCTRAMLIENGRLSHEGSLDSTLERYLARDKQAVLSLEEAPVPEVFLEKKDPSRPSKTKSAWLEVYQYKAKRYISLLDARIQGTDGKARLWFFDNEPITVALKYQLHEDIAKFRCVLMFYSMEKLATVAVCMNEDETFIPQEAGTYQVCCTLQPDLFWPRDYVLEVILECRGHERLTLKHGFELRIEQRSQQTESLPIAFVRPRMTWSRQRLDNQTKAIET